jgi:DNA-binding response OmpR family regulator
MKVLVVDDEPKVSETVKAYLESDGYGVHTAANGVEALKAFKEYAPDLVILDLVLPDLDGEQVCTLIRAEGDTPVIMLSAKSSEESHIKGYEVGADDYVTKPFRPRVLMAKVRALLRRAYSKPQADIFERGGVKLNDSAHTVRKNGKPVDLTPTEYNILLALMKNAGKLLTREQLICAAFGDKYPGEVRVVDSYIKQLRQKLEDNSKKPTLIITVHGFGYKLEG